MLMSEQFEADYKLTRNLELLTDKLQQTYRELEGEKQKTDRYEVLSKLVWWRLFKQFRCEESGRENASLFAI